MKNLLAALLMLPLLQSPLIACVNTVGTTKSGEMKVMSSYTLAGIKYRLKDAQRERERHADKAAGLWKSTDLEGRNDYAVELMYLGKAEESISILQKIEMESPGLYYTASNLGTAYELTGNNAEALRWIREGMVRNSDSHEGTEWLHVKILEAKIKAESDTAYFRSHTITGAKYGELSKAEDVGMVFDGRALTVGEINAALRYQLHERVSFVAPPDVVVGIMLAEFAETQAIVNSLESVGKVLDFAGQYGYSAEKIASSKAYFNKRLLIFTASHWMIGVGVCSAFLTLVILGYRRRWYYLTHRQYLEEQPQKA